MFLIEKIQFKSLSLKKFKDWEGQICIVLPEPEASFLYFEQIDEIMKGNLKRCFESEEFRNLSNGNSLLVFFPNFCKNIILQADSLSSVIPIRNWLFFCVVRLGLMVSTECPFIIDFFETVYIS